jgi:hypothetical protein
MRSLPISINQHKVVDNSPILLLVQPTCEQRLLRLHPAARKHDTSIYQHLEPTTSTDDRLCPAIVGKSLNANNLINLALFL